MRQIEKVNEKNKCKELWMLNCMVLRSFQVILRFENWSRRIKRKKKKIA